MIQRGLATCVLSAVTLATGCASTTWNGYGKLGTLKYSEISYSYTAQPVLSDPQGQTYAVHATGTLSSAPSIETLEKKGVSRADSEANIVFSVSGGEVEQEAGSWGLGGKYKPALIARIPIAIEVVDTSNTVIAKQRTSHEEVLGIPGAKSFKSRSEAKAAMSSVSGVLEKSATEKVTSSASRQVSKTLNLMAKDLFEPRKVSVTLPAIRSAGQVDMEAAYKLLAEAKNDQQVQAALEAYSSLGLEHKLQDGSDDTLGTYGVLCGLASAKILSGNLTGAWADTKQAWQLFPDGKEHRTIAQVLKQQEEKAGIQIIPEEDYDEMVNAEKKMVQDKLNKFFGGGG